jgi:acetylornithine deacetylase/succinyl-diaminopimelate desuccinylase-like protein
MMNSELKNEIFASVESERELWIEQLRELVAFPSLAFPGYDPQDSADCAEVVARMLRETGFADVQILDIGGQNPLVWGEHKADSAKYPDAPTFLLYAHYDVQPAPIEEQKWETDPWTLVEKDDRLFGRGSADDKAGIVQHLLALRAVLDTHVKTESGDFLPVTEGAVSARRKPQTSWVP